MSNTDTREALAALLRMRGNDLRSHPIANSTIDCVEEVGELLIEAADALATQPAQPSAQGEAVADEYGSTDFGYTFAGIPVSDGGKRLMSMLVRAFGTDHPAVDDLTALLFAAASAPAAPAQAVPLTDEQIAALRRLWPAIEKGMGCLVFTAEQAGAVQADMNTVQRGIAPKAAP